jgi:hypothetical protein
MAILRSGWSDNQRDDAISGRLDPRSTMAESSREDSMAGSSAQRWSVRSITTIFLCLVGLTLPAGALAQGPDLLSVQDGTLLHGNEASLAATDGDTVDVAPNFYSGAYHVRFFVAWQRTTPPGLYAHYTASVDGHKANCRIHNGNSGGRPQAKFALKPGIVSSGVVDFTSTVTFWYSMTVDCKAIAPYTLHWDRLSLESS